MVRFSFLLACMLLVSGCTVVKVKNAEKASKINADLGLAYLMKGRHDQALLKLNKALNLDPDNAKAYLYKAELYRRLDEKEQAEKFFTKALAIEPEDSSINNNYGAFLCANKKYDDAFKYFNVALNNPVYPDRGKVYENIGVCSESNGNLKVARENYVQAISVNPNLGSSLLAIAQLDFDDGNVNSASKYLIYYNRVARQSAQSLWLGILIARKLGQTKEVASLSWSLERKFPKSRETKLLKQLKASGEI